jgi:serine/threonine-protein kinase
MGQVFDQRYELLENIGGGGMADVYKAHDKLLDRMVAVKILHTQFSNDAEFIEKFHREAQGAAKLSHPNIVNIYDVGQEGSKHYIVMELVQGMTLKDKIQAEGHLSPEETLAIAKQIASALQEAHRNGLVHCDIKPHNILLNEDGRVKVADFGIARAVSSSTMTYSGNVVGSVHYFSPEQAKGSLITPKSDIYSLGVVMYEMLTGQLPFTGETPVGIALKHLQEEPPSLRVVNPEIPAIVEAVVMKMMSKDPQERPDSTGVLQEIEQAQALLAQAGGLPAGQTDPYATQVLPRVAPASGLASHRKGHKDEAAADKSIFKSKKFVFGLVLVLCLGFFVGAFMSFGKFWSNNEVEVPDVVGKQMTLARQVLEDKKLRVSVAETYDATVPAGQVVSQTPEAGAKVKEERLVTIYVSKGGEELEMPELKGLSRDEAEKKLQKMGLTVGSVSERASDEEAGTVISQDPRAGTKINKGQSVNLVISKGKKDKKVSVPDVTGATLDSARSALAARGFNVGSVTKQASKQAAGTVISQSPAANSNAAEGTYIDLVIAEPEKAKASASSKQSNDTGKAPSMKNDSGKTK